MEVELTLEEPGAEWMTGNNWKPLDHKVASNNLTQLLSAESMEYDTKIICSDGKELKGHRSILKSGSRVFERMLESGMSEQATGVIEVKDVPGRVMEILLQYIYTGNLIPDWKEPEIILEFVYAAGKYELLSLLESLDNALGQLELSSELELLVLELSTKLNLKTAEEKLVMGIQSRINAAKGGEQLLKVLRGE